MCTLLARLLVSANKVVDAETLFRDVWCSTEYHALRHRNTVYVAITRLRRLLRELLPTREVLETAESGWRLAQDLKVCVVRALP
jgi:DNA-binding response OmpR family regulator